MTAQLTIDFEPRRLARAADPHTSHEAAVSVKDFAAGQHETILAVLRDRGPSTPYEIADRSNLEAHAIGKRMKELFDAGRARVVLDGSGEPLTRKTPSGRSARVWYAL